MDLETSERIELEYQGLRSDNNFKSYENGKNLFFKWRRGIIDHHTVAQRFGTTPEAMMNTARRLDKKTFGEKDLEKIKKLQKKHVTQVEKTNRTIKKAQTLIGDSNDNKDPMNYSLEDHINQIMMIIDAEDSENLVELAVKVHRYIFLHEVSGYETLRELSIKAMNGIDLDDKETVYLAQTLNNMLEKKTASLDDKIKAIITEYGTLLSSAAADVMTDQEQQLDKLASFVLENNMDRLDEVVDLVDKGG